MWRGVQTMFTGCIPAHSAYFTIYESCKPVFGQWLAAAPHDPAAAARAAPPPLPPPPSPCRYRRARQPWLRGRRWRWARWYTTL